jgi:hypothetical protein
MSYLGYMKEDKDFLIHRTKEDNRIRINVTLLGICFTLFTFLIAFNPDLLKKNLFLTLQLVCSIPLFMTSLLARAKSSYTLGRRAWTNLGFITYITAYAFMINVVGIFLFLYVSFFAGIVFYILNIILAVLYSIIEVHYNTDKFKGKLIKDSYFIALLVLLGILPALEIY